MTESSSNRLTCDASMRAAIAISADTSALGNCMRGKTIAWSNLNVSSNDEAIGDISDRHNDYIGQGHSFTK